VIPTTYHIQHGCHDCVFGMRRVDGGVICRSDKTLPPHATPKNVQQRSDNARWRLDRETSDAGICGEWEERK
jgi:hypothetical protein